jgi:hypothetical protein
MAFIFVDYRREKKFDAQGEALFLGVVLPGLPRRTPKSILSFI